MSKLKKTRIIVAAVVVLLLIFLVPLASYLTKYWIEKYDIKYTGREITLDWAYVNPYTGYVHLDDLVIFEQDSDQVFLSMKGLSANMAMFKLLSKTYEIERVELNKPLGYVLHKDQGFNFSDVIEKFRPDSNKVKSDEVVRFNLLNIDIVDGEFHYAEETAEVNFSIKNVNISSEGMRYDVDTMPFQIAFSSGVGSGDVKSSLTINLDNLDYRMAVKVDSLNLEVVNQYLKDLINYGSFAAILDADMESTGNFNSVDSLSGSGKLVVSDFHFGKNKNEDFASFEQLAIDVFRMSPKNFIYHYDSITLKKPFLRYERYDELDNIQTMFGAGGQNVATANADPNKFNLVIEIAKLIEQVSKNLLRSHYKVGRLAIYDGDIQFSDYSLGEKFHIGLSPFSVIADSVDKEKERIKVQVKSRIQPYGDLWVALSVNPKDSSFFDLDYRFEKIPLSLFNPYIKTYTSFPLDRGSIEMNGKWNVRAGEISSKNHLIIIDPRVSKRVRNKDTKWIPVPLAMSVVRERGNVIDYEIPISGNLNNPKFNFWDVITDLLKNIFVKPVTIPYHMEVKNVEHKLEKSLSLKWDMQGFTLSSVQERFVKKMVRFLKKNPEATITISPQHYLEKEQEFVLLYEAKKKYFLASNKMSSNGYSRRDSIKVQKMSIKDVGFVKYLDAQVKDATLFTAQEKAVRMLKQSVLNSKNTALKNARKESFLAHFKAEQVDNRVKFTANQNVVPFNGFSFYEISYDADFPKYLQKAYDKMNNLDSESPRDRYKNKRDEISDEE